MIKAWHSIAGTPLNCNATILAITVGFRSDSLRLRACMNGQFISRNVLGSKTFEELIR